MLNNRFIRTFIYIWVAFFCTLGGFLGYTILSLPDVTELINHHPETTAFIEYRKKQAAKDGEDLNVRWQWIDLQNIPELLQRTVIVSEDAAFWSHEGVDWYELKQSIRQKLEEGKRLRGASTISQQTAKNLYLNPNRNIYRKFQEFLITRDLESHLSKERILELYLNYIEFGEGIFGVKSAALYYFGKTPAQLNLSEMIRLTAIIPAPLLLHPRIASAELRWRSYEILRRLYRFDFITRETYLQTKSQFDSFF